MALVIFGSVLANTFGWKGWEELLFWRAALLARSADLLSFRREAKATGLSGARVGLLHFKLLGRFGRIMLGVATRMVLGLQEDEV